MGVPQDIREIHIDAQHVSDDLLRGLIDLGYVDDHFVGAGNGMERPPYHLTWQVEGPRVEVGRRYANIWALTIAAVEASVDFVGYVEAEVIPAGFQIALPDRPFRPDVLFPLTKLPLEISSRNKVADLHVKVPIRNLTCELETLMADRGVFYVETPSRNRIYTWQFLSHRDGRAAFAAVSDYFSVAAGATEISYEVCPAFYRQPAALTVPGCITDGAISAEVRS